jgi:hypothetical protein
MTNTFFVLEGERPFYTTRFGKRSLDQLIEGLDEEQVDFEGDNLEEIDKSLTMEKFLEGRIAF